MKITDKAYLAGMIDARGAITTNRHLRIGVRQKHRIRLLEMCRELGPGGFTLGANHPASVFICRGRRYKLPARKILFYEFGVFKTLAILEVTKPYLRRWAEFQARLKQHRK